MNGQHPSSQHPSSQHISSQHISHGQQGPTNGTQHGHPPPAAPSAILARTTQARIPTDQGEFLLVLYQSPKDTKEHLALVLGDVAGKSDVLVRVHSECFTGDVLGSRRCDCGDQLTKAMQAIADEGAGVVVYLRQEGRGIGLADKLRAYNLQDQGYDTVDANLLLGHQADERDYTAAALILRDLGIRSLRLLTNNPAKISSLRALGIEISERVPIAGEIHGDNAAYLSTKVRRMHHLLQLNGDASPETGRTPVIASTPNVQEALTELTGLAASHRMNTGLPFVTLSYAQSLDGCVAAVPGRHLPISSPESMAVTHALRASHDAILVGIGTALADDPRLNVRLVDGPNPQPIVVDSRLRLPVTARLLQSPPMPWIATTEAADPQRQRLLEQQGARVLRLASDPNGHVDLRALLERLAHIGVDSVMVEGGPRILTSFLASGLADYVVVTIAPMFVGGVRAIGDLANTPGSSAAPAEALGPAIGSQAVSLPRLRDIRSLQIGPDLMMWGRLK